MEVIALLSGFSLDKPEMIVLIAYLAAMLVLWPWFFYLRAVVFYTSIKRYLFNFVLTTVYAVGVLHIFITQERYIIGTLAYVVGFIALVKALRDELRDIERRQEEGDERIPDDDNIYNTVMFADIRKPFGWTATILWAIFIALLMPSIFFFPSVWILPGVVVGMITAVIFVTVVGSVFHPVFEVVQEKYG